MLRKRSSIYCVKDQGAEKRVLAEINVALVLVVAV